MTRSSPPMRWTSTRASLAAWSADGRYLLMEQKLRCWNSAKQEALCSGTAHLLVDKEYDKIYASNYGGESISVINLNNDGSLGELEINHEYNDICQKSNPHQVLTKGNWVFVVDLGCDKIWHYIHEANGQDWLRKETDVKTGAGPRHGVFHQTKDLMFLLCEQQSLVQVYRFTYLRHVSYSKLISQVFK